VVDYWGANPVVAFVVIKMLANNAAFFNVNTTCPKTDENEISKVLRTFSAEKYHLLKWANARDNFSLVHSVQ